MTAMDYGQFQQSWGVGGCNNSVLHTAIGGEKEFEEWKSSFNIESYQNDISSLLVSCSHVRTIHSQLVPAKVSYEAFWMRYFYRIRQLQKVFRTKRDVRECAYCMGLRRRGREKI